MKLKYWILALLMLPFCAACDEDDDVEDIFYGKTWKLTSVMSNSKTNYYGNGSDEQVTISTSASNAYYIYFSPGTEFMGRTATQSFSGTYTLTSNRKISFNISQSSGDNDEVSAMMLEVLKNATHYKGDTNSLSIYEDDGIYLLFYPVK